MRVEVYFCQMDRLSPTGKTCTFVGEVDLSNLELLENIPYKVFYGNENIYPYLTDIGKARVESVYPAPALVTEYIALVSQKECEFQSCPACKFSSYDNMLDMFRKMFGVDKESVEKRLNEKRKQADQCKTKSLSQIITDGKF